jgi:hypothetical protein
MQENEPLVSPNGLWELAIQKGRLVILGRKSPGSPWAVPTRNGWHSPNPEKTHFKVNTDLVPIHYRLIMQPWGALELWGAFQDRPSWSDSFAKGDDVYWKSQQEKGSFARLTDQGHLRIDFADARWRVPANPVKLP